MLRRPLVDDLLQEVAREHNPLTGSTLNANPYHSQKGHGKWNAATPHSSKSQERYRWCAVGQAIPESGHGPQDPGGCLKSMGGEPVVEWRSLEGKWRDQWEAGLTVEKRGVLTAELVHKPSRGRTES